MSFRRWLFPSGYRAANHYNRGTLACRSGDWISAETHLREAVQAWQDYPEAWHNLGIALAGQGRFQAAIEAYETALSQRRNFAEAWNNFGGALAKAGRLDDAREAFTESLRLNPSYQKARENLDSFDEIVERHSDTDRNERLFKEAYFQLAGRANEAEWPELQRQEHIAWYAGGSSVAESAVTHCEPLRDAWGRGDERNAIYLSALFTLPVILRFYGYATDLDPAERKNLLAFALSDVLTRHGELPVSGQKTLDDCLALADQLDLELGVVDRKEQKGFLLHFLEVDYLLAKALLVLGKSSDFSLAGVRLPVRSYNEFLEQGGVPGLAIDLHVYGAMFDAINAGADVSLTALRAMRSESVGD